MHTCDINELTMNESLLSKALQRANQWLNDPFDSSTRSEVNTLIAQGGEALIDAFHTDLEFGTGGLRGIMGAGTNRMNAYTLGLATQGFANHIKKHVDQSNLSVVIAHDCRHNSKYFTQVVADVFASNGFVVYLFDDLRPTPLLSFAVRELGCAGGVVITASHNPPEYNGFKVYWSDGGQVTDPHDRAIIDEVRAIASFADVKRGAAEGRIRPVGRNLEETYLSRVAASVIEPEEIAKAAHMPMVFTSLHGTAITLVPQLLQRIGFTAVHVVAEQAAPDGDFSTVASPNPEEGEALSMAIAQARELHAELVMGTDPDGDRVGIAVRKDDGDYELLNGNDTGALLVWYQLARMSERGTRAANGFVAKTIVTSDLIAEIARGFDVPCYETLTGFKHIARLIADKEPAERFITGGEESYGYMIGDFVRDKDGAAAAAMIAELTAWAYNRGLTVVDLLQRVHEEYGLYREALVSLKRGGLSGAQEITTMMAKFRSDPPSALAGLRVLAVRDYASQRRTDLTSGTTEAISLPPSNVLQFELEGGSLVTARPSGTEPKIKFYFSVRAAEGGDYFARRADAEATITRLKQAFLADLAQVG